MLAERIQRGFSNLILGRVEREVAQYIKDAVIIARAQERDRRRLQFQIGLILRDAQDCRRDSLATMSGQ